MSKIKTQVLFIGGGEAYSEHGDYLQHLQEIKIEPFSEPDDHVSFKRNLAEDLGSDWQVEITEMPSPRNAKYQEWTTWFEKYLPHLEDGAVLVGHSLGAMFLCRYISENTLPFRPAKLFLLAAAFSREEHVPGQEDGEFFYTHLDNFKKVEDRVGEIHIMHSTDDSVVSYRHAELFAQHLPSARLHSFTDRDHFFIEHFPELVAEIKA